MSMSREDEYQKVTMENLSPFARECCKRAGWATLTPVQTVTCPCILAGKDVMVQSRTGSGKTGAYLLPVLEQMDRQKNACQVLILVPTRELASQVYKEASLLIGDSGIKIVSVYGGVGYKSQLESLRDGAQLVVGTPGRILDHLLRQSLVLKDLHTLVLDEADRMLSMGFYPDMKQIQSYLAGKNYLTALFSATYPPQVLRLTKEFLREPEVLSLSTDQIHVTETEHVYYEVPQMEKDRALVRIIENENPASAIIFCNTKENVHYVTVVLSRFGYDAEELSSSLSQSKRERVLSRLRAGNLRFLVATDVAARGIDIPDLSHVIQYEPSEDPEIYVHRAGRTGRAGASGRAITLVNIMEELKLQAIGKKFRIPLEKCTLPTQEEIETLVGQRVIASLETTLREKGFLQKERIDAFVKLAGSLNESEEQRLLLAMLLDNYYSGLLRSESTQPTGDEKNSQNRPKTGNKRSRRRLRPPRQSESSS